LVEGTLCSSAQKEFNLQHSEELREAVERLELLERREAAIVRQSTVQSSQTPHSFHDTRHREKQTTFADLDVGLGEVDVANEGLGEEAEECIIKLNLLKAAKSQIDTSTATLKSLHDTIRLREGKIPTLLVNLSMPTKRIVPSARQKICDLIKNNAPLLEPKYAKELQRVIEQNAEAFN
uniref:Centromere protein H n=1 Tax=Echinostoma caproni TaxID=27848 RepID=A0A183B825_9TREM